VLVIALFLYFYRRTVEDKLPIQWRERTGGARPGHSEAG